MKKAILKYLTILVIPLIYFVLAVATLSDYGINWDEPFHFNRGHAYLHFFLTGKKSYLDLPSYPLLRGSSDFMGKEGESELYLNSKSSILPPDPSFRRSYFLSDVFNFDYFIDNDGFGHPPASGILAAASNFIFYHKLGLLGDIEAHHLFEIIIAGLLILGVSIFTYYNFGVLASLVASISLAAYPLFFSESHFNIKDPPEAGFLGLTIVTFYFGILKKRWPFLIISALIAGLALGTKFNAIFLPFIILPWLVLYLMQNQGKQLQKSLLIALALYPFLVLVVFYAFWPYLWSKSVEGLLSIIRFYREVGTTPTGELNQYIYKGFNLFPALWITITTPLPILLLALVGFIVSIRGLIREKQAAFLLVLVWFLLPILRVSLPGTAIHSGVRHIMEFIPAMAILAGIGAQFAYQRLKDKVFKKIFIILLILAFGFVFWEVGRLHPNENVYFNQLIGGLPGAMERNIPYWGYSYGNVYWQGVEWLNQNAEPNAKLGLAITNMVNVPRIKLRPDIDFSNSHVSGPARAGEYVMEMSHNWSPDSWYSFAYYNNTLNPVYEVKVDGVSLLKIWKNDLKHSKRSVLGKEVELKSMDYKLENKQFLTVGLEKNVSLTKIVIGHSSQNCQKQKGGYIRLSSNGKDWIQESETIDYPQLPVKWLGNDEEMFIFLFSEKRGRFIFLDTQMENSCILKNPKVKVFGFENLP